MIKQIYRSLCFASVFFVLLGVSAAQAQSRTVTGKISDVTGQALPGVNVIKKGTTIGTNTDANGNFSLDAASEDVLVVSFIGYVTEEVQVGAQTKIDVTLNEDIATLQEVVVVGYGEQKKSDVTGAIASINGDNLRGTVTASVDQALQGRVAGVQVSQNSGAPGGAVSIRIRGTTSLTQSSEPLYIIDGLQVGGDAGAITGFDWQGGAGGQQLNTVNPLAAINPSDIESIEVLKDASATAIYGSRAANGVVIITTKRGKKGSSTISYNGYYAIQEVYKTFDMMDLRTYAEYNNEVSREVTTVTANPRFADPSLLGPGTDWQDAVFQVAPMQSHTLTATGGNERTQYMISGGYFTQEGIIIGSKFDRFNIRLNLDSKINDRIKVGTSISASRRDEKITLNDGGDGVISQAAQMPPNIPVRNFDGTFAGPETQNASSQVTSNPVGLALLRNNKVYNNRLMTNMYADAEIVKDLNFRTELGVDYGNTYNVAFLPTYNWGRIANPTSQLAQRSDMSFYWLWKNYLTYKKTFGNHDLTALLGYEAQRGTWESFTAYKVDVPNDLPVMNQGGVANRLNTGSKSWNTLVSQFARINYGYNDKYLLTATIRRDGSSRFGPNNRWGVFPSLAAAWKISNEAFFGSSEVLSNLKLRAGWGKVGNQEISNYAFGSALESPNTYFGPGAINAAYSNPDVQWEATASTNLGLDAEFFSGRINFSVEAYLKKTSNLLVRVDLPATFGDQVDGPQANVGTMENKGLEFSLSTINVDKGKFKWTTNANLTINRNEVISLGSGQALYRELYWYPGFETASKTDVGRPVGQFYGYVSEGLFTSKQEILDHAVQITNGSLTNPQNKIDRTTGVWLGDIKWKDLNNDGKIDSQDQTYIGDPNPDYTFGFNNSFSYGPFSLDVFMIGSVGGDIMNYSRARNEQMTSAYDNQSMSVKNRARIRLIEGGSDINNIDQVQLVDPSATMPRFDNGYENHNHYMSSRWIEDGTYVRIQNVKVAYTLPSVITQKARITRAQIYANLQNVATFTNYSGLDPQVGAFNQSSLQQGIDMGRYPSPRVYTFGVSVDF